MMNFKGYLKTASHLYKHKYTYSDYADLFSKVTITCPLHGQFERIGIYHIYGDECPTCQRSKQRIYYNYVMQSENIIKIGRSANVFARMSELSFDLGRPCLLHNVCSYNSRREAWDSERFAHSMFKQFNISPFDLKFAGSSEFFKIVPSMACNALIISGGKLVYKHH
ncbi:TPA: GIY-YIG nuclease family protein [Enterobacter hormaechei subsp. xiangfangensis]|nr:GIY-YIG nuclease family protein [Enterobacter hormaechei subsp. xiangfangensis]HBL8949472.1 GIY-YIG nuclease family protein [Enterobacter hormaechei]HBL8990509.1 GIY-YIG nuclease family protein [Enterobacter hormaechei]HCA3847475.1 GIY-YIG nuclease family protein [Enterobacter hormaechei]HCD2859701.1 GIY-YIG nuclease family protein [Enterobacter hormaechei]